MSMLIAAINIPARVSEALAAAAGPAARIAADEASLVAGLADAEAVILRDQVYTAAVAAAARAAPRLRWIGLLTAGFDNARAHGVPPGVVTTSVGDAFSPSVAVHAVALLLALERGIHTMLARQAEARWDPAIAPAMIMPEGRTALIVGFGSIGQETARLLRPFGRRIIGVNRSGRPHALADEMVAAADLRSALPLADAIILALPLEPATRHLIGAPELALCKPGALIVNISRGGIIDQAALVAALAARRIGGAALDVTEPEPLPGDDALWRLPNVIVSPHVAGAAGPYGIERQIKAASENIRRWRAGEQLLHVIEP